MYKQKCTVPHRGQTFSIVLLLSHTTNNRDGTPLSALALSTNSPILLSVILNVAPIAIVVLLGSVVHILSLFVLWDAEL